MKASAVCPEARKVLSEQMGILDWAIGSVIIAAVVFLLWVAWRHGP
jgi:hypothetical protein